MKTFMILFILSFSSLGFTAQHVDEKCMITGCSGQICMNQPIDKEDGIATTCEYREYYACFKIPNCVLQKTNQQCGWETSPMFLACLKEKKAPTEVLQKYAGRSVLHFLIKLR